MECTRAISVPEIRENFHDTQQSALLSHNLGNVNMPRARELPPPTPFHRTGSLSMAFESIVLFSVTISRDEYLMLTYWVSNN